MRQPSARAVERNDYKKQVFKYCTEQASAGEEIEIKELSAELPGDGDLDFTASSVRSTSWKIASLRSFDPARGLTKFVGSGGGLTLSFEQKLLNSRVFYDPQTDTLTIKGSRPTSRISCCASRNVICFPVLAKDTALRCGVFYLTGRQQRNQLGALLTN